MKNKTKFKYVQNLDIEQKVLHRDKFWAEQDKKNVEQNNNISSNYGARHYFKI